MLQISNVNKIYLEHGLFLGIYMYVSQPSVFINKLSHIFYLRT